MVKPDSISSSFVVDFMTDHNEVGTHPEDNTVACIGTMRGTLCFVI